MNLFNFVSFLVCVCVSFLFTASEFLRCNPLCLEHSLVLLLQMGSFQLPLPLQGSPIFSADLSVKKKKKKYESLANFLTF